MPSPWSILANSLWVLGFATLLAGGSWAYWMASTAGERFGVVLRRPPVRHVVGSGTVLLCAGLAATSPTTWERLLWAGLAIAGALQAWFPRWHDRSSWTRIGKWLFAHWGQILRWTLGLGLTALSCWLLLRNMDWPAVWAALRTADYRWVTGGVAAIIATFFTRTWRWQALLRPASIGFRPAMTALLIGQVANTALPLRSGDVARAVWIGPEAGTGVVEALASVAVEKLWDLLALVLFALIALLWMPLPDWLANSAWGGGLALLLGGALLWAGLRWQEVLLRWAGRLLAHLPARWGEAILPRLERLVVGLAAMRQPGTAGQAFLGTMLTWGLGTLANLAVLAAFGLPSVLAALVLLVALTAGRTVPTPGQLGIHEGLCVLTLALFRVPPDTALAAGVVLHVVVVVPALIAAALLAPWSGRFSHRGHAAT